MNVTSYSKVISASRIDRFIMFVGVMGLLSLPVHAEDHLRNVETIADVRCVIIGMRLAAMEDASQRSAGTMLILYYLGRLEGRNAKLDIEGLLLKSIETVSPSEYESEAKRCGMALTEKGQQITKIGKDLSDRAPKPR